MFIAIESDLFCAILFSVIALIIAFSFCTYSFISRLINYYLDMKKAEMYTKIFNDNKPMLYDVGSSLKKMVERHQERTTFVDRLFELVEMFVPSLTKLIRTTANNVRSQPLCPFNIPKISTTPKCCQPAKSIVAPRQPPKCNFVKEQQPLMFDFNTFGVNQPKVNNVQQPPVFDFNVFDVNQPKVNNVQQPPVFDFNAFGVNQPKVNNMQQQPRANNDLVNNIIPLVVKIFDDIKKTQPVTRAEQDKKLVNDIMPLVFKMFDKKDVSPTTSESDIVSDIVPMFKRIFDSQKKKRYVDGVSKETDGIRVNGFNDTTDGSSTLSKMSDEMSISTSTEEDYNVEPHVSEKTTVCQNLVTDEIELATVDPNLVIDEIEFRSDNVKN